LHGALVIALALLVLQALRTRGKSLRWALLVALAAIVPFGTFALDRRLRADDEAYRRRAA
jgi:hypothetical protein